ncbi:uncharacterized protein CPUR_08288 [Claviceps purpurea 20.1]|uniref:Uncharacterized protein n=1 Tax=Claviceps purpurea (strain 20.1) TaxID=1111077 RepID=M1W5Y4_CLAP2|nr:uncharacterized protein CPUR_08288 [Claviceps purpurea 20.1]
MTGHYAIQLPRSTSRLPAPYLGVRVAVRRIRCRDIPYIIEVAIPECMAIVSVGITQHGISSDIPGDVDRVRIGDHTGSTP